MPNVRAILKGDGDSVVSVGAKATVLEAARLMAEKHVGAVVVTEGGRVTGIFTERDLLNRVVAQRLLPEATRVEEVMTAPVACCSPDTTRAECIAFMRRRRIRHLPVVEDGRLAGIVSIRDILEDVTAEQEETILHLHEYMHGW